ncbi:hypothetical protein BC936DRAFT_149818 [Jimgerdemannia flammicorona]|uniref:Uncharacterized protein n=1 Tax=Jimgerdemannia flammicorona TaxID=994334 RepID=A0A433D027_9FUNG|nr:hypothetical protein BC936DRAFT_149818 [Jimgerdemannia flammicorona]
MKIVVQPIRGRSASRVVRRPPNVFALFIPFVLTPSALMPLALKFGLWFGHYGVDIFSRPGIREENKGLEKKSSSDGPRMGTCAIYICREIERKQH